MLEPLHPHQLLRWFAIPRCPGAYVLGSFARHVTIYSQQMRAFNLVEALVRTYQLEVGTNVVVIGGGIAGVTAAAAAAARGAVVTLVEKEEVLFPIQRNAGKRYLHPHIYDWPLSVFGVGEEMRANFPFLGWTAGEADQVFRSLEASWQEFRNHPLIKERPPAVQMSTTLKQLTYLAEKQRLEITLLPKDRAEFTTSANIVILALGFGKEYNRPDIERYWDQSPLDSIQDERSNWLVSGYGDGGLTDLMRLCIQSFRHDKFVQRYAEDNTLIARLKELLGKDKKSEIRSTFKRLCDDLDRSSLIDSSTLRSDTNVTLNAPDNYLESDGSSILNRFIVYQLENLKKFERQAGKITSPPPPLGGPSNLYTVEFVDQEGGKTVREFQHLVVRHGPAPALSEQTLPGVWKSVQELAQEWKKQSQESDRTRIRIWDPVDFDLEKIVRPRVFDPESPTPDLHCVVLESTSMRSPCPLSELVEAALADSSTELKRIFGKKRSDPEIGISHRVLRINDVLVSSNEYANAVKLLCQADIAVIDVTGYEPGVMLFLGIRSAARRGVTLVTTNNRLDSAEWSELPFNLKELYPISVDPLTDDPNSPLNPTRSLGTILIRALNQFRSLSFYQDVPAYEGVRRFETGFRQKEESLLLLCPLDGDYKENFSYIYNGFSAIFGGETTEDDRKKYRLERIIEIVSPQLVSQRLYTAIRLASLCLADWTGWRKNVFFEFGVRSAVNSKGAVCLISSGIERPESSGREDSPTIPESQPSLLRQRELLEKIFNPIRYGRQGEGKKLLREIRSRHLEMQAFEAPVAERSSTFPSFGLFPYDFTNRLVSENLPLHLEPGAVAAHAFLTAAANDLIGASASDLKDPVLFSAANSDLMKQVRGAGTELLVAAWYYLSNRYSEAELSELSELGKSYRVLGERLADLLQRSPDPKDVQLGEKIGEILVKLESNESR